MSETPKSPVLDPDKICALSDLPNIDALPEAVKDELRSICRSRSYDAGQTIAEMGEPSEMIGIVSNGILRMQKTLPDGRQHVVGLLVGGDLFGRVFDGNLHFSIEAATDVEVFTFRRQAFESILQRSPELDRLLLLNLLNELDRARDWMIILANPKVRGRLAGFLLILCTRFRAVDHLVTVANRVVRVKIPISRTDLANLLGTRVESISRAFHALADEGLLTILRPDLVEICSIEDLSIEAGEPEIGDPASLQRLVQIVQKSSD